VLLIGTAGWSIPKALAEAFPGAGSHLERYAAVMPAAEINSSFYRPHRRATYERWAASTPEDFRFSVKVPKEISHVRKLVETDELLAGFFEQVGGLGTKLGVLLLQLPPSLAFEHSIASSFLDTLRRGLGELTDIACEPRHSSWFGAEADGCLRDRRVARVVADPVLAPGGELPGGWTGLRYRRLHGSPRVYYSAYDPARLDALADTITPGHEAGAEWCIFDNTASGAAAADALYLMSRLHCSRG
jgi:uncharacterized protein YecE (DUF72 family)